MNSNSRIKSHIKIAKNKMENIDREIETCYIKTVIIIIIIFGGEPSA